MGRPFAPCPPRNLVAKATWGSPEMFLQEHNASFASGWRVLSPAVKEIANAGRLLTNETKCSCRNTVENSSFGVIVGWIGNCYYEI